MVDVATADAAHRQGPAHVVDIEITGTDGTHVHVSAYLPEDDVAGADRADPHVAFDHAGLEITRADRADFQRSDPLEFDIARSNRGFHRAGDLPGFQIAGADPGTKAGHVRHDGIAGADADVQVEGGRDRAFQLEVGVA